MTSSLSSSTSSVCTSSTDDARPYHTDETRNFLRSAELGIARLLRTYSARARAKSLLARIRFDKSRFRTRRLITIGAVVAAVIITITIAFSLYYVNYTEKDSQEDVVLIPPDPEIQLPPSSSKLGKFKRGVVCADGAPCAAIGKKILEKNGSAVDAAVAALICNGLVNMQSMGLGGGFLMTIYNRRTARAYMLNARDRAPLAATANMFEGKPPAVSSLGALSIGVPGELAGYWEAHRKFGELPWADLFEPSIELCEKGYILGKAQYDAFERNKKSIYADSTLRDLFVDTNTGKFYKPGERIRPKTICKTLRIIAKNNATIFYNGILGEQLVRDLQKKGSIITMKDLNEYRAEWDRPLNVTLSKGVRLYTAGIPGSGALLTFILNVFDGFGFTATDLADFNATTLTYHRMIETFKYAYALRSSMGDKDFVDMTELLNNARSKEYAQAIRERITDNRTFTDPAHYGSSVGGTDDHGTSHISVLAPSGDAVSVTSTINFYFGSGVVSEKTGIIMNNAIDDFGIPSKLNYFGIPPSPNNYIAPRKQAVSSMVPSILVQPNHDVKMVVGAAGGTKITTGVAQTIAKVLWMEKTVKEAVDDPRVHHQLLPMEVSYEYGVPKQIVDGLKKLGHKMSRYRDRGSIVCLILYENGTAYANADYRKDGNVHGFD